jgi:hypothetical protein
MQLLIGFMFVAIVLDHAHLACPITLTWGNRNFRDYMLRRPEVFVLVPALCVLIPFAVGTNVRSTHDPAFRAVALVYFWFNIWHFASQNWGICALAGGCLRQRAAAFLLTLGLMVTALFIHPLWVASAGLGIDLMHWIMDIRLSAYVARRQWLFTGGMLILGLLGFLWKWPSADPLVCPAPLSACAGQYKWPTLLGLRFGLGFWHFLASRWVWSSWGRELLA